MRRRRGLAAAAIVALLIAVPADGEPAGAPPPAEEESVLSAPALLKTLMDARSEGDEARAEKAAAALVALSERPPAAPAEVREGRAPVGEDNLIFDLAAARLRARLDFPAEIAARELVSIKPDESRAGRLLTRLVASGRGAGLLGVVYDNRDRGHSRLRVADRPGLAVATYSDAARAAALDVDLNDTLLFDATVVGNASKALTTGPMRRSLPRLALTTAAGAIRQHQNFAEGHLYVFPEHRDHDPGTGDLFHAAVPYFWVSQGSSGSDQPILGALVDILAAMRPETRAFVEKRGLLGPTVQMLFRRGLAADESDAAYLSGEAHPSVFPGEAIDRARMIRLANALAPEDVPPAPRLAVLREPHPAPGIALFADGLDERLFDTPQAVSRLARGALAERRYVLAGAAEDPNGRPLDYKWVLLRGDPERVRIEPLEPDGRVVEVSIGHHTPRPVPGRPDIESARVDIGLFVGNGAQWSSPAFFSLYFPQDRDLRLDEAGRVAEARYGTGGYADPALFPSRDWTDLYRYDADGSLLGWTRRGPAGEEEYTRHGFRVLERDSLGRPTLAEKVDYPVVPGPQGRPSVAAQPEGGRVAYVYRSPDDALGELAPVVEE